VMGRILCVLGKICYLLWLCQRHVFRRRKYSEIADGESYVSGNVISIHKQLHHIHVSRDRGLNVSKNISTISKNPERSSAIFIKICSKSRRLRSGREPEGNQPPALYVRANNNPEQSRAEQPPQEAKSLKEGNIINMQQRAHIGHQ
jgi:hypothetical protein